MRNTGRWPAILAALLFIVALGAGTLRAETDDKTIDLSASDKKVQVWHKSADGKENLIDISQTALDAHLAHGDRLAAPGTSSSPLTGPLGAPVMDEHDSGGAGASPSPAADTASVTGTEASTGTTPAASPSPASSPAAFLPGLGSSALGGPLLEPADAGAASTPATTSTMGTPPTTSTTGTPPTTTPGGTIPAEPATPASPAGSGGPATPAEPATPATPAASPASSPAAALPGSDVTPLGAPLASANAIDVSKAFTGLVNTVPSAIDVKTYTLTDASLRLDTAQLDSLKQQITASPGAAQNQAALEDSLRKANMIGAGQRVIGVLPETREILFRRAGALE